MTSQFQLTITLEQPLLITALLGDPNSSVSTNYLPGSVLRGVFVGRFFARGGCNTDPNFRRLFLSDGVRFLNAYPVYDQQRCLPTPRSLLIPKGQKEGVIFDSSHPNWNVKTHQDAEDEADAVLKPLGASFSLVDNTSYQSLYMLQSVQRSIAVHIKRHLKIARSNDNKKDEDGEVFRYESLAAHQQFIALIEVDDPQDADHIKALAEEPHARLGRSRSAQYGRVIWQLREHHSTLAEREWPVGSILKLHLQSDLILRNMLGAPVRCLDDAILSDLLGVPVQIDPEHSVSNLKLVGGFNTYWNAPLPQSYALEMGSVITFRLTQQGLSATQVQQLHTQGIGERCNEGFGKIGLQLFQYSFEANLNHASSNTVNADAVALSSLSQALANFMQQRIDQQMIDEAIMQEARKAKPVKVARSQLARVANIARKYLPSGDLAKALGEFEQFKPVARRQFERARWGEKSLEFWIKDLLDPSNPQQVWHQLKTNDNISLHDHASNIFGQPIERDAQLACTTALRLIIAVMHALSKENRDER